MKRPTTAVKPVSKVTLPALVHPAGVGGLGCGIIGLVENVASIASPAYWAAQTRHAHADGDDIPGHNHAGLCRYARAG
jgi:hypothetical protein